jgi:hypothetical protein
MANGERLTGKNRSPCAHFYPPHPLRDGLGARRPFQHESYAAFQDLLVEFGDPALVEAINIRP